MVEFPTAEGKVRINPALVASLYQREGTDTTTIVVSADALTYEVPGNIEQVDDKLTAHYTDVRYVAFVLESLCAHLKVEIVPPSRVKVEVVPPTSQQPEQES